MRPNQYSAELIYLDGKPTLRIRDYRGYHVGYFTDINKINDHGREIDKADIVIKGWALAQDLKERTP